MRIRIRKPLARFLRLDATLPLVITMEAGIALSSQLPAGVLIGVIGYCIAAATGLLVIVFALANAIDRLVDAIAAKYR